MAAQATTRPPSLNRVCFLMITRDGENNIDCECLTRWVEIIQYLKESLAKEDADLDQGCQVTLAVLLDLSIIEAFEKFDEETGKETNSGVVNYGECCWIENADITSFLDGLVDDLSKLAESWHQISATCDSTSHMDKVAQELHRLVDKLPAHLEESNLLLETFWVLQKDTLPFSSCIAVYGALKRLQEWHNSKISILYHSSLPPQGKFLKYWSDTLSLSCVNISEDDKELIDGRVLWHGKILINHDQGDEESTVFPGFTLARAPSNELLNTDSNEHQHRHLKEVFTDKDLQVLDVISRKTVPLHKMLPFHLKLSLPSHPIKSSKQFLERFLNQDTTKDVAMLACLRNRQIKRPRDYSAWTKYVCSDQQSGTPTFANKTLPTDVLLLLLCCDDDGQGCSVYPLRSDIQNEGKLNTELALIGASCKLSTHSPVNLDGLTSKVPMLPGDMFLMRQTDLIIAQLKALDNLTGNEKIVYQDIVEELSKVLTDSRKQYIKEDTSLVEKMTAPKTCNYGQSELQLDPSLWPERLYLKHLDASTSEGRIILTGATLGGLPVPAPKKPAVPCLDAKEILRYFCNGVSTSVLKSEAIKERKFSQMGKDLNSSLDDVKRTKYPAALLHKFHGIEYCIDSEDAIKKDKQTTTLQACYINSETSSACLPTQLVPSPNPEIDRATGSKHKTVKKGRVNQKIGSKRKVVQSDKQDLMSNLTSNRESVKEETELTNKKRKRKKESAESQGSEPASTSDKDPTQETRSQRHMRRLQIVVDHSLKSQGVTQDHPCYENCSKRLLTLCKSFLKDLKTSAGLNDEMKRLAKSNVKQVVKFEMRRQKEKKASSTSKDTI